MAQPQWDVHARSRAFTFMTGVGLASTGLRPLNVRIADRPTRSHTHENGRKWTKTDENGREHPYEHEIRAAH